MSSGTVQVINGPNLGRLGRREPHVYGSNTHDDLVALIEREATELGLKAVVRQSDNEAELLGWTSRAVADLDETVAAVTAFTDADVLVLLDHGPEFDAALIAGLRGRGFIRACAKSPAGRSLPTPSHPAGALPGRRC